MKSNGSLRMSLIAADKAEHDDAMNAVK